MIGGSKQYETAMGMMAIPTTWQTHTELDPRRFPMVHDPMRGYQSVQKVDGRRTHLHDCKSNGCKTVPIRSCRQCVSTSPSKHLGKHLDHSRRRPFDSTGQKSSHTPSIMPFLPLATGRKPPRKRMPTLVFPAPTTCTFENGVYLGRKRVQLQVSV